MFDFSTCWSAFAENWHMWVVAGTLVVAAVIDGWKLKVPNLLTFPFILAGLAYHSYQTGWSGFGAAILGTAVGLGLLLPLYAIGGMGSGDVKLLAGVGAWVGWEHTLYAFAVGVTVGGFMALAMILASGEWRKHFSLFKTILWEIKTIHDPVELSTIAAERKKSMLLLPYGIPITIGAILYFAFTGMLP